jgi:hypothetical protein
MSYLIAVLDNIISPKPTGLIPMPYTQQTNAELTELAVQWRRLAAAFVVQTVVLAVFLYSETYFLKEPYNTSSLLGELWLQELLHGHPMQFPTQLGVNKHVFQWLVIELKSISLTCSKHLTLEEHIAIFLYTSVTALSSQFVAEHFQHSLDMITQYIQRFTVLNIV